jgi:hypothetical protein
MFPENSACFAELYRRLKKHGYAFRRGSLVSFVEVAFKDVFGEWFVASLEINTSMLGSLACGQYRHPEVHPETGDVCIDFGAYMGETSLLMAELVGDNGRVFAVEFGENFLLLKKNLTANPKLEQRIQGINQPFWCEAGRKVFVTGAGTTAKIEINRPHSGDGWQFETHTLYSA